MYDPEAEGGHREANAELKRSLEEILNLEEQQEWTLEQMSVPPQTDRKSCGNKMLCNINRLCKKQELETIGIEEEEAALEGYMIDRGN